MAAATSSWLPAFGGLGVAVIGAVLFVAWIYSLWELAFKRDDLSPAARVGWAVAIVVFSFWGLVAYVFFGGRRKRPSGTQPDGPGAA